MKPKNLKMLDKFLDAVTVLSPSTTNSCTHGINNSKPLFHWTTNHSGYLQCYCHNNLPFARIREHQNEDRIKNLPITQFTKYNI